MSIVLSDDVWLFLADRFLDPVGNAILSEVSHRLWLLLGKRQLTVPPVVRLSHVHLPRVNDPCFHTHPRRRCCRFFRRKRKTPPAPPPQLRTLDWSLSSACNLHLLGEVLEGCDRLQRLSIRVDTMVEFWTTDRAEAAFAPVLFVYTQHCLSVPAELGMALQRMTTTSLSTLELRLECCRLRDDDIECAIGRPSVPMALPPWFLRTRPPGFITDRLTLNFVHGVYVHHTMPPQRQLPRTARDPTPDGRRRPHRRTGGARWGTTDDTASLSRAPPVGRPPGDPQRRRHGAAGRWCDGPRPPEPRPVAVHALPPPQRRRGRPLPRHAVPPSWQRVHPHAARPEFHGLPPHTTKLVVCDPPLDAPSPSRSSKGPQPVAERRRGRHRHHGAAALAVPRPGQQPIGSGPHPGVNHESGGPASTTRASRGAFWSPC